MTYLCIHLKNRLHKRLWPRNPHAAITGIMRKDILASKHLHYVIIELNVFSKLFG